MKTSFTVRHRLPDSSASWPARSSAKVFAVVVLSLSLLAAFIGPGARTWAKKGGGKPVSDYEMTDLLGFPATSFQSDVLALSDRNYVDNTELYDVFVVGDSRLEGGVFHPALWNVNQSGAFDAPTDLFPDGYGAFPYARQVGVVDVNRWGEAVSNTEQVTWDYEAGECLVQDAYGNCIKYAFVHASDGTIVELPTFPSSGSVPPLDGDGMAYTAVSAMNDHGTIVGTAQVYRWVPNEENVMELRVRLRGARWQIDEFGVPLGPPDDLGDFRPSDVNNEGVMIGNLNSGPSAFYPAMAWFDDSEPPTLHVVTADQTVPGDQLAQLFGAGVVAINDASPTSPDLMIVGNTSRNLDGTAGDREAFAWKPNDASQPAIRLGALGDRGSTANDVNLRGEVVGWSYDDSGRQRQSAFLWKDGVMTSLNELADVKDHLQIAVAINNDGDIGGIVRIWRPVSEVHGFLLRRK